MSVRSAVFMLTCVVTGLLFLASSALAQVRILPGTEFDHVNTRKTKSAQIKLESMQASNDFESILSFREGSRYRRTGWYGMLASTSSCETIVTTSEKFV